MWRSCESAVAIAVVCSTFLDGGSPDNAKEMLPFLKHVKSDENLAILLGRKSVCYCVVGVGDSSWPKFCQYSSEINIQMQRLKCNALLDIFLVDSSPTKAHSLGSSMSQFTSWLSNFQISQFDKQKRPG